MINVVNLWHHYGIKPILQDINLHINPGELVTVMGPNGMGKSTLLGLMAGTLVPIRGYVEINGLQRRSSIEAEKTIRKKVFYLPDTPFLPLYFTGREFVLAMGYLYSVPEERLMSKIDNLFDIFDMAEKADSPILSYSAGQKKKIGICSALITEVPVYILDEPFSGGLDSSAITALSKILAHLAQRKDTTVVMAMPVPELVENFTHRIAIVANGKIIACDNIDNLRKTYNCNGNLGELLKYILDPEGNKNIERYLEDWEK